MTVQDLINKLSQMPSDALIVTRTLGYRGVYYHLFEPKPESTRVYKTDHNCYKAGLGPHTIEVVYLYI